MKQGISILLRIISLESEMCKKLLKVYKILFLELKTRGKVMIIISFY